LVCVFDWTGYSIKMNTVIFLIVLASVAVRSTAALNNKSGEDNAGENWSGDVSKIIDNNVDSDIGVGWQLLSVEERDGKCPETKEKVERYKKTTTGQELNVITEIPNHQVTVFKSENLPGVEYRLIRRPELNCMNQDDEALLEQIRKHYLLEPSKEEGYNSSQISEDELKSYGEMEQDAFLDQFLFKGGVKNGFFVEAGADDFVSDSNSLMFERAHGWTGLLVEPWLIFAKGLQVQRKAWSVATCLATKNKPHFANFASFSTPGAMAGLVPDLERAPEDSSVSELQCFPLSSLLLALGNPTVNYLSLDLEGAELEVIKTIPFDQLNIEVLSVEFNLLGKVFPGSRSLLHLHLSKAGYSYLGTLKDKDDLFAQSALLESKYKFSKENVSAKDWPEYSFWVDSQKGIVDEMCNY